MKTNSLVLAALAASMADLRPDPGTSALAPGFYIANDSRFGETYFSEPLTTYAVGFRDPNNIEETLQFLAPEVSVPRKFEWAKAANAQEFLSETDDVRAIGADFKRVQYDGTHVVDKTLNKGLMAVVDLDNVVPGSNWEQAVSAKLMRRILRNELRRAFTALSAAATNTAKTWNSSADPDQDLQDDLETAASLSGIRPNRVVIGATAWNLRRKAYRAQNNAGGYASAMLTPDQLGEALLVDKVVVSKERYQSSASAKSEVIGSKTLSFYADELANTEDPSNIKRFVTEHDAEQGGGRFQVYRQNLSAKLVAISVSHYSKVVVTYATGIRQFTVS